MLQLPKIALLLSSLLFLFACQYKRLNRSQNCAGIALTSELITPVIQNTNTVKFNANMGVMNNNFSGIVLVKETDSLHQHIVFVNELGMKMFDFTVLNNEINATYVFGPMNKPAFVEALKRNMKHLLLLGVWGRSSNKCSKENEIVFKLQNEKYSYFLCVSNTNKLQTQYVFYKKKLESKIEYVFDDNQKAYTKIVCKQKGFGNINIELQQLITE